MADHKMREDFASPSEETLGEILPPGPFADVYRAGKVDGLPCFARLNAAGAVELYLVFESIDAFSELTEGAVTADWKTYQRRLLAVIWTRNDPVQPLGFPLSFDMTAEQDQQMVRGLLEQPQTQLFHLALLDDQLIHVFTDEIRFSAAQKREVEQMIQRLSAPVRHDDDESAPADSEVREAPIQSIPAAALSDDILVEAGTAYTVDFAHLEQTYGAKQAEAMLMSAVYQALLVMRRHGRSQVRETAFTVWAAQCSPYTSIVITPELSSLFADKSDENPFLRLLVQLPGFVEHRRDIPLSLGAFPIMRYERGTLLHVELEEPVIARLAALFARLHPGAANPYSPPDQNREN
ncbi:hypothetical protein ACI7RC_18100 [Brevibacillus sp. B_LB10_24]|uniref:hypothetical protein n=1 Tax=Brevibacillus sp. B_LB10_24 TaxID=3380645 RepID=UPI0038BCA86C